ncbi:PHP domain protein, partial [Vibrio cholerae CP1035(8)]
DRVC